MTLNTVLVTLNMVLNLSLPETPSQARKEMVTSARRVAPGNSTWHMAVVLQVLLFRAVDSDVLLRRKATITTETNYSSLSKGTFVRDVAGPL